MRLDLRDLLMLFAAALLGGVVGALIVWKSVEPEAQPDVPAGLPPLRIEVKGEGASEDSSTREPEISMAAIQELSRKIALLESRIERLREQKRAARSVGPLWRKMAGLESEVNRLKEERSESEVGAASLDRLQLFARQKNSAGIREALLDIQALGDKGAKLLEGFLASGEDILTGDYAFPSLRIAALSALLQMRGDNARPILIETLRQTENPYEIEFTLRQLFYGDEGFPQQFWSEVAPKVKRLLSESEKIPASVTMHPAQMAAVVVAKMDGFDSVSDLVAVLRKEKITVDGKDMEIRSNISRTLLMIEDERMIDIIPVLMKDETLWPKHGGGDRGDGFSALRRFNTPRAWEKYKELLDSPAIPTYTKLWGVKLLQPSDPTQNELLDYVLSSDLPDVLKEQAKKNLELGY